MDMPTEIRANDVAVTAHVLFVDIVGYSTLPLEQQHAAINALTAAADTLAARFAADGLEQPVRAPSGDGFAVVFLRDLEGPARWALALQEAVRSGVLPYTFRMGLHSGPVFRGTDVNQHANVRGDGINLAARVMTAAQPGQTLASAAAADQLRALDRWRPLLTPHGHVQVKHGVDLEMYALHAAAPVRSRLQQLRAVVLRPDLKKADRLRYYGLVSLAALLFVAAASWWVAFHLPFHTRARSYVRRWGIWEPVDAISRRQAAKLPASYEFTRRGYFGQPEVVRKVNGAGACANPGLTNILGNPFESDCNQARACEVHIAYETDGRVASEAMVDQFGNTLETLSYDLKSNRRGIFTEASVSCGRAHTGIESVQLARYEDKGSAAAGLDRKLAFFAKPKDNGSPNPAPNDAGAYGLEFQYDAGGRVTSKTILSPEGRPQLGKDGYATVVYTYDPRGVLTADAFRGLNPEERVLAKDGSAGHRYAASPDDRLRTQTSVDTSGNAVANATGTAITETTLDEQGNVVREAYFDTDHKKTPNAIGVAGWTAEYDTRGNRTLMTYVDVKGQPTFSNEGYAAERNRYDARNVIVEIVYLNTAGKWVFVPGTNTSRQLVVDDRGNHTRETFIDGNGKPTWSSEGYAAWTGEHDEFNNLRTVKYLGPDGTPTLKRDGIGILKNGYDRFGNRTSVAFFDTRGNKTLSDESYHRSESRYELGQEIEARYLDTADKPAGGNSGVAFVRVEYDPFGNQTKRRFLDPVGLDLIASSEGIAGWRSEYDRFGHETDRYFFDAKEQPTQAAAGYYHHRTTYDQRGHRKKVEYFGRNDEPILISEGYAVWESTVDVRGNALQTRFRGTHGELVVSVDEGVKSAGYDSTFDERGRETARHYVDIDNHPAVTTQGYAYYKSEFDDRGNETSRRFFDLNDKRVARNDGAYGWKTTYDDRNRGEWQTFLDATDTPLTLPAARYASRRWIYDDRGREIGTSYFDSAGRPTLTGGGQYASERITKFDERGNPLVYELFDQRSQLLRRTVHEYDPFGRETWTRYFSADNRPMLHPGTGRAAVKYERDAAGRVLRELALDVNGRPVNRKDLGWAERRYDYSPTGVQLKVTCRRTNGAVVDCRE